MQTEPTITNGELLNTLRENGGAWHPVDAQDVSISEIALDALKLVAKKVLARHVPAEAMRRLTVGDAVSVMTTDCFWHEDTGRLFVCAELGDNHYCLPIPPAHWSVRVKGAVQ